MSQETVQDTIGNSKKNSKQRPTQKLYIPKSRRILNENVSFDSLENQIQKNEILNDPSIKGYIVGKGFISADEENRKNCETDENLLLNFKNLNLKETNKSLELDQASSENDWFNKFNDKGECIDLNYTQNKKSPIIEKIDYLKFDPLENFSDEEYGHIIEIFDFPKDFKNEHIYNCLKEIVGHRNFDIKWVDDTHCLGVFSCANEAFNVIKTQNNILKTRSLSKATPESRVKAQRSVNYMKPYKQRPQTTSFVASRLIGASLGINNLIPNEKLKLEKNKLQNAREKKLKDKEIKEAIWNGDL